MKNQNGFLSILAVVIILIMGLIGASAAYQITADTRGSTNELQSVQAFYLAQSGIERAKRALLNNQVSCTGINGNANFTNATFTGAKGVFTVTASFDNTNNQCLLSAVAGVPSINSAEGKRIIGTTMASSGISPPAPLIVSGIPNLQGSAVVYNPTVSSNSTNYSSSTIITNSTVTFTGKNASTQVADLSPSSSYGNIKPDISQNNPIASSTNLFSNFFSQSKTAIKTAATKVNNLGQLTSTTSNLLWMNSDLTINSNTQIGSPTNPVILIVNGNVNLNGTIKFYGLLYSTGNIDLQGNINTYGAVASEGATSASAGNPIITFDPTVLNSLYLSNSTTTVMHYYTAPSSIKETIP